MNVDKHGHLLRIGDLVRLPSGEEGVVQCFAGRPGSERVVVGYDRHGLGEVTLLPRLVERLGWRHLRHRPSEQRRQPSRRGCNRVPCGESHYRARLTDEQVREMRELHRRAGKGYELLALIFGCGVGTARDICTLRRRRDA